MIRVAAAGVGPAGCGERRVCERLCRELYGFGPGTGSGPPTGSGGVAQAASNDSARRKTVVRALITEPYTKNIYLGCAQAAAQHVQFIEIVGRTNVDAVVIAVIDLDALGYRFDPVQREFSAAAIGIGVRRKRTSLQNVEARLDHGLWRDIGLGLGRFIGRYNFDVWQDVVESEALFLRALSPPTASEPPTASGPPTASPLSSSAPCMLAGVGAASVTAGFRPEGPPTGSGRRSLTYTATATDRPTARPNNMETTGDVPDFAGLRVERRFFFLCATTFSPAPKRQGCQGRWQ